MKKKIKQLITNDKKTTDDIKWYLYHGNDISHERKKSHEST